jgi:hypothetical protein
MYEIQCGECNKTIAYTSSSEPLPFLYCPECAEKEKEKDEAVPSTNTPL